MRHKQRKIKLVDWPIGTKVRMVNCSEAEHYFLSRLCGGQGNWSKSTLIKSFLSRLCGGQVHVVDERWEYNFLSRLCGGQGHRPGYGGH